jgi:hypothetical protein
MLPAFEKPHCGTKFSSVKCSRVLLVDNENMLGAFLGNVDWNAHKKARQNHSRRNAKAMSAEKS